MLNKDYSSYLRAEAIPSIWCPGCGNGLILKAMVESLTDLKIPQDQLVVVGGIGCSGRTPFLLDCNTMHTTHGRAVAFATGIKLARPSLKVIVVMGDGDASAIGGNHFIHACRRNIELTAIIFNNSIYGLTGGQAAPTTPQGKRSTTSPLGSIEPAFDLCALALGACAGFVARSTVFDFQELRRFFGKALTHNGFSLLEVLTTCPTYFGRMNDHRDPYDLLHQVKVNTNPDGRAHVTDAPATHLPCGIFRDQHRPEYTELYRHLCEVAQNEK